MRYEGIVESALGKQRPEKIGQALGYDKGFSHITCAKGEGDELVAKETEETAQKRKSAHTGGRFSFEASIALSYSLFTYTYYNVLTDYYGTSKDLTKNGKSDTSGADYHELKVNYTLPIGGLKFMAKVGHQHTPNLTGSQSDYAIGLNRDFALPTTGKPLEGFNAGATFTGTFDVDNEAYYFNSVGEDVNQKQLWFYVKRTW